MAGLKNCIIKAFDDLLIIELYAMLRARCEVFTVEQRCNYLDLDGIDQSSHHILVKSDDNKISSYCRLVSPEVKYGYPSIGRVLTLKEYRGHGMCRDMLLKTMEYSKEIYPDQPIVVAAQAYLEKFYSSLGFVSEGDIFIEAGIEHIFMKHDWR